LASSYTEQGSFLGDQEVDRGSYEDGFVAGGHGGYSKVSLSLEKFLAWN
jgi:hypothetical protein